MGCPPLPFINSFINLRGPEGLGNVGFLEIDVSLVHLYRAVTARLHRHVYGNSSARPFSQSRVPQVVKDELLDARGLIAFSTCTWIKPLVIRVPSLRVKTKPLKLDTIAPLFFSHLISSSICRALSVNGETCSTPALLASALLWNKAIPHLAYVIKVAVFLVADDQSIKGMVRRIPADNKFLAAVDSVLEPCAGSLTGLVE